MADRRELFDAIAAETVSRLDGDPVHDIHHAWRVCNLGSRIAEEEGADAGIAGAASLTHDLHRARGDAFVHPRETLPAVREILSAAGFPERKVSDVCHCVAVHEEYDFEDDPETAETLEAEVLQDADNLDAIGAIGIARTFAFGGAHRSPLWRPDRDGDPIDSYDKFDDGASTLRHVREKLLRLAETMNTQTGTEIAAERHEFLERFVDRFEREWTGEL